MSTKKTIQPNTSLSEAIEAYLDKGFGSMNKNDFEVFIFHVLLISGMKGNSDNVLSRQLRIPETKVKRLRYEADLKYGDDDNEEESYRQRFYEILRTRVYKETNNKIQFSIKDTSLRLYLNDKLDRLGSFADSSFNSDIVTLTANDLLLLLSDFEGKDDLVKHIKESIKSSQGELPKSTKEVLNEGVVALTKDLTKDIAPNVSEFLFKQFKINNN